MKVLIVFNHPAPYKVNLFNEIAKYVDLDVIFEINKANDRPDSFYNESKYNFNCLKLNGFSWKVGRENVISLNVKKYIEKNHQKYDLIIMNGYSRFQEMIAIKMMNKKKIPFILLINGGLIRNKETSIKKKIKKYYISSAFKYISPGEESDKYLIYYGAKKEDIYHYEYSSLKDIDILDSPLKKEEKNIIREKYNLPINEKIFVCPNQFIKRKNNLSLIEQFENKNAYLLLIGDGKEKNKYLKYIKKHNIKNALIWEFLPKAELMDVMKATDGLISLSNFDIYGHTILEGLACGLPVLASKNIVSAKEIIKNGINGFALNNDDELFDYISQINEDMPKLAIASVTNMTIEKSGLRFKQIFDELKK